MPGYNVRLVLIFHAMSQLREVYGVYNAETMLKSLAARIVFAAKDIADAQEISNELGFTTVKVKTVSRPLMDFDSRDRRSRSVSISEQRRALFLPQEVKELGNEEAIVFYEGLRPIRCRKIRYFADSRFRRRLLPPPIDAAPHLSSAGLDTAPRTSSAVSEAELAGVVSERVSDHRHQKTQDAPEYDVRDATVADVERIDSLTLDDFEVDLSKIEFPDHDGPLSDAEMTKAVASFLSTLDR
jgi:type IV secretion system protein VirD4